MKKTIADGFDTATVLDDSVMAPGAGPTAAPNDTITYSDEGEPFPLAAGASTSAGTGSSAPVASIATLADWLVNGFWTGQGALAHHWASNTITYNLGNLNAAEQALALSALNAWHDVANINFVQTSGTANISFNHNGTMQAVTNASWNGSGQMTSATVDISTDWVTSDGGANDGKTGVDSYAYQTYLHEIGHALGLGHQGPYNGSASYSANAIFANDTWQYSIMSYFSEPNYSGSSYRYVITPQMADIYAVALMYGAATTTRTGNTVYGFNNTAGAIYNFASYSQAPALTIYDSGGTDTLDCSGYSSSQTIDLRAGNFSSVGGLKNNIGIALGTVIENAIGGGGSDALIANDNGCSLSGLGGSDTLTGGAGDDRLTGGSGRDTLTGNGGADTFVFASGDSSAASGQHDSIADFTSADRIDISAMGTFRFLGTGAFDGGTYALDYFYNSSTGLTTLQGDINGDRAADFAIDLTGNVALAASYIVGAQTAAPVVIEAVGTTNLVRVGNAYYLNPAGGGTGPVLSRDGSAIFPGQYNGYLPYAAEATATGYVVAFKDTVSGQFSIWTVNSSGSYVNNIVGIAAGNTTAVQSQEPAFHQDLNGDGTIGVPPSSPPPPNSTIIEAVGTTSLVQVGNAYYLNPAGGGTGPVLSRDGSAIFPGQYNGYLPYAAEATASGYVVAFKDTVSGQFSIWTVNSSGSYVNNIVGIAAGNTTAVQSQEPAFHQDLNGDGTIGVPPSSPPPPNSTIIEAVGTTSLVQVGNVYYLNPAGGGTGPVLSRDGSAIFPGQYNGYLPYAAEATASGYVVAFKDTVSGQFSIWTVNSSGSYVNNIVGIAAGNTTAVQSQEPAFHQDLNGDGTIGVPAPSVPVGATGSQQSSEAGFAFSLASGGSFLFHLDNSQNVMAEQTLHDGKPQWLRQFEEHFNGQAPDRSHEAPAEIFVHADTDMTAHRQDAAIIGHFIVH